MKGFAKEEAHSLFVTGKGMIMSSRRFEKRKVYLKRLIFAGIGLFVLFWCADAVIDGLFDRRDFFETFFTPSLHEAAGRGAATIFLLLLTIFLIRAKGLRRQLEDELEAAVTAAGEEKIRSEAIIAAIGDAVSIQDTELRILYQNQAHREMMGEHVGEFCYAAYQGRENVCDDCHLMMSFQDGLVHRRETYTPKGGGRYVEIISSPLKNATGTVIAGIETVRDITGRKELEIQLRKHMAAIESSMDGIAILDADENYTYVNPAHARIYGYDSPAELIGRSWRMLYDEEEVVRFERNVMPALRETGRWQGEALGRKSDGSFFPQEVSLNLIEHGGLICVVRDIGERKEAEEEIQKLNESLVARTAELSAKNKELESFGYSLSHDLRNHLTRLSIAAQALHEDYREGLGDTGRYFAKSLKDGIWQMEELIEAMLVLSRASRSEMRHMDVDMSGIVEEIAADLRIMHPLRNIEFIVSPGVSANGDPELLRVVLENLLDNAWKYTKHCSLARIEFGVAESAGKRAFFIRDNGIGFSKEDAERIFKPFERLHRTDEFPGTGIGLATVARIIERHGGEIWCEGEVDRGATFYFTLP